MLRRRWVQVLLILLLLIVGGIGYVIYAVWQVRPFYTAAMTIPKPRLVEGSREFLNRTSRFSTAVRKLGEWSLTLSDEQINGWFAVDLVNNHPDALPTEIQEPRLKIEPGRMSFGVMIERDPFPVAASLDVTLKITGPRELAFRVIAARAGTLPWSVDQVVRQIRRAALDQKWTVRETTIDNDPVLLLTLPREEKDKYELTFEALELREGELYIRGRTSAMK